MRLCLNPLSRSGGGKKNKDANPKPTSNLMKFRATHPYKKHTPNNTLLFYIYAIRKVRQENIPFRIVLVMA